ncbi:MAG: ABC transporter permease [Micromonosporaceae bacterium]|jgi:ABC-2 type transport system permease protein|nr:ABC transporter permease [Micromonosporaceae bacterium]
MKFLRDTWLILQRQLLLNVRQPVWVLVGVFQPVMFLLLFAPLLKPALATLGVASDVEAYRIFVPGLLVMLAMFGGLFQGFGLIAELRAGIIERSRVTPVNRVALLLGRALRDVVVLLGQAVIITVLSLAFGLRVALGYLLLIYVLLALIGLATAAISYAVALRLRAEDSLSNLMTALTQPILLLSGILLPMSFAPVWLQHVAEWNPFYWAVNSARALAAGDLYHHHVWQGMAVIAALAVVSLLWATREFRRSIR